MSISTVGTDVPGIAPSGEGGVCAGSNATATAFSAAALISGSQAGSGAETSAAPSPTISAEAVSAVLFASFSTMGCSSAAVISCGWRAVVSALTGFWFLPFEVFVFLRVFAFALFVFITITVFIVCLTFSGAEPLIILHDGSRLCMQNRQQIQCFRIYFANWITSGLSCS